MNARFVEPGSDEWRALWHALGIRTGGDVEEKCPDTGEVWQYMGTFDGRHQFRHRHHPRTKKRELWNIGE